MGILTLSTITRHFPHLPTVTIRLPSRVPARLHWHIADFVLGLMLVGPLIMPFFLHSGWPPMIFFGNVIYQIGQFICPQLPYSASYGGMAFAVCYRCSAALVGLVIARGLHRPGGALRDLSARHRVGMLALCLIWLTIDVQGTARGWWPGIVPLMLVHGLIYGISVGGVVYAVLMLLDRPAERELAL